jgi:hypothetical protein
MSVMDKITGFIPGTPWLIVIALALGAGIGYQVESWRWDASLTEASETKAREMAEFYADQRKLEHKLTEELAVAQNGRENDARDFKEKLNAAKNSGPILSCGGSARGAPGRASDRAAGSAGEPDAGPARVTCGPACISLWHDALAIGLPQAFGAWRADAAARAPGSVTDADLFGNAGRNFEIANKCRAQLLGWQRWARDNGLVP